MIIILYKIFFTIFSTFILLKDVYIAHGDTVSYIINYHRMTCIKAIFLFY